MYDISSLRTTLIDFVVHMSTSKPVNMSFKLQLSSEIGEIKNFAQNPRFLVAGRSCLHLMAQLLEISGFEQKY